MTTFKVVHHYSSVDMSAVRPEPKRRTRPPVARRSGVPVFRVNRHHRKRAWQTRDAVVDALEGFFSSLDWIVYSDWRAQFSQIIFGALSQPTPLFGTEDAPGLFRVKGRWSPSYLIRWKNGRGRYRGTLAPEYTPVSLP